MSSIEFSFLSDSCKEKYKECKFAIFSSSLSFMSKMNSDVKTERVLFLLSTNQNIKVPISLEKDKKSA